MQHYKYHNIYDTVSAHNIIVAGSTSSALFEPPVSVWTDGVWRGTKLLNLKSIVDKAQEICSRRYTYFFLQPLTTPLSVQHSLMIKIEIIIMSIFSASNLTCTCIQSPKRLVVCPRKATTLCNVVLSNNVLYS